MTACKHSNTPVDNTVTHYANLEGPGTYTEVIGTLIPSERVGMGIQRAPRSFKIL